MPRQSRSDLLSRAADAERCAKEATDPRVKELYQLIAEQWRAFAENSEAIRRTEDYLQNVTRH